MNIANKKEINIIKSIPPVLVRGDRCAIDTEWFGMDKRRLHRPHGIHACTTFCFNDRDVYVVTDVEDLQQAFENVDAAVHIFVHAKFDITQLRKYISYPNRKNLWDCMLIEQIMFSGYYSDFALNDLVRRHTDTYLPKDVRNEFHTADGMTQEMLEYSCLDTLYTRRVAQSQKEKISEDELQIWRGIELPFLWALLGISGVRLDSEKWIALARKNEEEANRIQAKYGKWVTIPAEGRKKEKEIFDGINLNSPAQVKKHFAEGGVKLKSTDAEALEKIIADGDDDSFEWRFANDLLAYRTYAKRSSTYGEKFVTDHVEPDGKIYADIYQIGAETGRTSCRAPNLQNQPHLPEYRECFIADKDKCMIVADWGSQEPKFAAHFSQDEGLIAALNSDEKLYVRIAREALDIHITKQSPEYTHIKSTILGLFYGMSANGLSKRIGVSEEDAQHMIDRILDTYPGIAEYMRTQKRAKDYVTSVTGRKIWLNKYSFQWERNALNAPIQGSAADAMKIAAARFMQTKPTTWELLLLVHDEIVLQVPEADSQSAKSFLAECMISVAEELHEGIKGSAEVFDGGSWACKH
jgi:DNA polymerase-1